MKKQTGEVLLLAGVLIILAVVAVWQYRQINPGNQKPSTPAASTPAPATTPAATPAPATASAATPAAMSTSGGATLSWVDPAKVSTLVAQVKTGRNPFRGQLAAESPTEKKTKVSTFRTGRLSGTLFTPPPSTVSLPPMKEIKLARTLEWISPQELAQAFTDAKLEGVKLMARKGSEQVIIVGLGQDNLQKAVDLVNSVDVPPPAPNFQLQGIVSTDDGRFVALRVDGKFYTLREGSVVPNVGWVVTRVTPNRVTLAKDKQSVQLLLAGGHV